MYELNCCEALSMDELKQILDTMTPPRIEQLVLDVIDDCVKSSKMGELLEALVNPNPNAFLINLLSISKETQVKLQLYKKIETAYNSESSASPLPAFSPPEYITNISKDKALNIIKTVVPSSCEPALVR